MCEVLNLSDLNTYVTSCKYTEVEVQVVRTCVRNVEVHNYAVTDLQLTGLWVCHDDCNTNTHHNSITPL